MATNAEIRQSTLELLGVIAIGQGAESQHDAKIAKAYTEVYSDLKEEGLATWAESGTIPDAIAPHLEALLALNSADSFGISNERYSRILSRTGPDGDRAKRAIRSIVTPKYESLENPENF